MKNLTTFLIQRARDARDALAVDVQHSGQALHQAEATLTQLQAFRGQLLERAPARAQGPQSAAGCADWQAFVAGLDRAHSAQAQVHGALEERHAQAQDQLVEAQRRLRALEALESRRQAGVVQALQRMQQRECDDFAARASRARLSANRNERGQ